VLAPLARGGRGSALLLVPAGVLIFIILAAITVDFSHLYLAKRELHSVASAVANDAAGMGIDSVAIREGATPTEAFNLQQAREAGKASFLAQDADGTVEIILTTRDGRPAISVSVQKQVRYIFAPGVPGGPSQHTVAVTAYAYLLSEP
jgi:Flp pilus assembly protein TadG